MYSVGVYFFLYKKTLNFLRTQLRKCLEYARNSKAVLFRNVIAAPNHVLKTASLEVIVGVELWMQASVDERYSSVTPEDQDEIKVMVDAESPLSALRRGYHPRKWQFTYSLITSV